MHACHTGGQLPLTRWGKAAAAEAPCARRCQGQYLPGGMAPLPSLSGPHQLRALRSGWGSSSTRSTHAAQSTRPPKPVGARRTCLRGAGQCREACLIGHHV